MKKRNQRDKTLGFELWSFLGKSYSFFAPKVRIFGSTMRRGADCDLDLKTKTMLHIEAINEET